jgi:phosphoesterase RecJ-like protein
MIPIEPPHELLQRLQRGKNFLVTGHVSPDGDSIGSALALSSLLETSGKSVTLWNRDETPEIYAPLPGADRIHVGEEPLTNDLTGRFDAAILVECPTLDRSGLATQLASLPALNIDHHLGNGDYGTVNWVDPGAPALGEMVLRLSRAMQCPLDGETATLLLVALTSDTGGFRFSNATERAYSAAADLVRAGARPTEVSRWLYESRPYPSLLLLREMLSGLALSEDGRIASVVLTREMFERAGATAAHSEGLIDQPRSIAGVEAVALVRELEKGRCKISLRSRGALDVERIARRHGGGGHRNAAGFVAIGEVEEVRRLAVHQLEEGNLDESAQ